jgi:nucleoside-diphosphate-sugar epimerase
MNHSAGTHVIFGSGPLGLAVMRELVRREKEVRVVNRSGKIAGSESLPVGVEVIAADAYQPENTRRVCAGAVVVYQCAQPAYMDWVEKFPALQASILKGAGANGARLIVGENLYMYGEVVGPIHEELPYQAKTKKGQVRAQMAERVLEAHAQHKVQAAIGRGSDFYGPHVLGSSLGDRFFGALLQGKTASLVGRLDQPHTYTYIDDFGKALVMLGEREEALGGVWHVPNPPTLTQGELARLAFQTAGLSPKFNRMGRLMMTIGGLFIPEARETVEMLYEFERPFIVDSSKFIQAFGDIATPHKVGLQQTLTWYQQYLIREHKLAGQGIAIG